jgi:6-phosphogluconolactonase
MNQQLAYVGTYTDGDSEGLYTYEVTVEDGGFDLQLHAVTPLQDNPSFLTVHPTDKYLYTVHEVEDGGVTAFRREDDGSLHRLNHEPSGAGGPCHCSVHPSGDYLLVAHYTDAVVSVLPIRDSGDVSPPSDTVHHNGSSIHSERQTQSHPHSITPGPKGRYLYVPDLGTDEIVVYELNDGTLEHIESVPTQTGAGPRHIVFHPSGRFAYVINELNSTLTAFELTPEEPSLDNITAVSTLPETYNGNNAAADVHVHPSGQWVYGSNRGHDSIAVFAIDQDSGIPTTVDHQWTGGEWPRNFTLDATGGLLFAENQRSNSIVGFRISETTGTLERTNDTVDLPAPVCMCCTLVTEVS